MARKKQIDSLYDEEESDFEYEQEHTQNESNSNIYDESPMGEPIKDKESVVSNIFDTRNRISLMKHRLRGDLDQNGVWTGTEHALAPESFINKQIGAMESIIDTVNSFSKKNETETKRILHDAVHAFILDMVNEPEIDEKDFRTMAKAYEHSLELFLGLVEYGHGAKVLQNTLAGIGANNNENNERSKLREFLGR